MAKFGNHKDDSHDHKRGIQRFETVAPLCKICKLDPDQRQRVDMMLATGWTQIYVVRHWNDLLEDQYGPDYLTAMNMSRHARRHVSTREMAVRKIVEERARQQGLDIQAVEGLILTKEAVTEAIIASGLQSIVQGHTIVEPKDMVAAIGLLKTLEEETSDVGIDELWKQYHAFADAVKKVVSIDMWDKIVEQFDVNLGKTPASILQNNPQPEMVESTAEEIEEGEFS